jgi:hypothetical protein
MFGNVSILFDIQNEQVLSIEQINTLISFFSLIIAIIALIYAKWANGIANKQRIDNLMPDIAITVISAKISLFSKSFPHMQITSICKDSDNSTNYILQNATNEKRIQKNELIQKVKIEFIMENNSPNNATVSIKINKIGKKDVFNIGGLKESKVIFEKELEVPDIKMAKKTIEGAQKLFFKLIYNGIEKKSYDIIKGSFIIPYRENYISSDCLTISEFNSEKKRIYNKNRLKMLLCTLFKGRG